MPIDFLSVRDKIKEIGKGAPQKAKELKNLRDKARGYLESHAKDLDTLSKKVEDAARQDFYLRSAKPVNENLDEAFPLPAMPKKVSILAADGSQVFPDRHAPVSFFLINVGAIVMHRGSDSDDPVKETIETKLFYGDDLYTNTGIISDSQISFSRDQFEREILADLAKEATKPIITLTDGPLELWGGKSQTSSESESYRKALESYKRSLQRLKTLNTATAGYVDKPRAAMVVQLLEVATAHVNDLKDIRKQRPLRGVTDADLYRPLLESGQRSAVFAIQSESTPDYAGDLALHFFYLNVGRKKKPWLARVEIPAWVAEDRSMLDNLHAVLVDQCNIMGTRAYPYLLHRSHEIAVVSREEKEQIIEMIRTELLRQQVDFGEESQKQAAKNLSGRRRFTLGSRRH